MRERERDSARGDLDPRGDCERAGTERLGDFVYERSRGFGERVCDRDRSIGDGERDGMIREARICVDMYALSRAGLFVLSF